MLHAFLNCAKTVLPALTSAQKCYQKSDCKVWIEKESLFQVRNENSPQTSKLLIIGNLKTRRCSNTLKGLPHEIDFKNFDKKLHNLA